MFASPVATWILVGLLFITALTVRLYRISELPLDFHPTRQYHSALIARFCYFETSKAIPQWRKDISRSQRPGVLEPPLMEIIACAAYHIAGEERLSIPRAVSSIFWLIGGAFLYLLARRIATPDAAVFSAAFYLFLPFGIPASTSFQPDPLMVMFLILSLWAILGYFLAPSTVRLIVAGALSGFAMFIKPMCLFPIYGAFLASFINRLRGRPHWSTPHLFGFLLLSSLPVLIFYTYGLFVEGFLRAQMQGRVEPRWGQQMYWKGWLDQVEHVIGYAPILGAFIGIALLQGVRRRFIAGLWLGYGVFGMVFTYHAHTHDYYHLQLIPIVALSLGPLAAVALDGLGKFRTRWYTSTALLAVFGLAVLFSLLHLPAPASRSYGAYFVTTHREIGEIVEHSTKTIFLSPHYGKPLQYHGELAGAWWPSRGDLRARRLSGHKDLAADQWFESLRAKTSADYFIVTDLPEFYAQRDLVQLLIERFAVIARSPRYVIFDMRGT